MRAVRIFTRVALGGLALAGAACGTANGHDASADRHAFVGVVEASDARIAIVTHGDHVAAYVCGGDRTFAQDTRWFLGDRASGASDVSLASEGDSVAIHLDPDGGGAHGEIARSDGRTQSFRVDAVAAGTLADLYATNVEGCRAGVIVTQARASDAPQVQGTWCNALGRVQQVTPVIVFSNAREKELTVPLATTDQVVVVKSFDPAVVATANANE